MLQLHTHVWIPRIVTKYIHTRTLLTKNFGTNEHTNDKNEMDGAQNLVQTIIQVSSNDMTRLAIKCHCDQRIKSHFLNLTFDAVGVKMPILLFK